MARVAAFVRATPLALLLNVVPAGIGIASMPAQAAERREADEPTEAEPAGPGWGRILGACFGVLFGGGLALWQIRSMKNRH